MIAKDECAVRAAKVFGAKVGNVDGESPDMTVEDSISACEKGIADIKRAHYSRASAFVKGKKAPSDVLARLKASNMPPEEAAFVASISWWRMIEDSPDKKGLDGLRSMYRKTPFASDSEIENARKFLRKWSGDIGIFARQAAAESISMSVPDSPEVARPIQLFNKIIDGMSRKELEGFKTALEASKSLVKHFEKEVQKEEKRLKAGAKGMKSEKPDENDGDENENEEEENAAED